MNEFLLEIQAILDQEKSKGNISKSLIRLQNKLDKLKIQAEIDPNTIRNLTRQLEKVINQKITITNIEIDQPQAIKNAQQTGQKIGNSINQGIETSANKAKNTLKSFTDLKDFSELNKSISNFHVDISELKNYKTILDDIKNTYSEFGQVKITNEIFKDGVLEKFKVNIEQVNGDLKETKSFMMALNEDKDAFVFSGLISGSESVVQHLDKTKNAVNQTAEAINTLREKAQIDKIQLSMSGQGKVDYNWQVDEEIKKLKNLGFTEEEVAQQVKLLTDAHTELKRVIASNEFDSIEIKNKEIIESDRERTLALNQVKNAYKELKTDANQYYNLNKQAKLSTDIQNWLSKNSRASKEAKESLNAYYRELSDGRVSVDRLNYIEQELKNIDATQRGLGKLGKNLKDQFKEASASFTQWLSVSSAVMALVYQLQRIPKEVIKVNAAMIELEKVSNASSSEIRKYFDEAAKSAKKYGSAVSDMINATADWSRLGYNLPDSKKLAEIATLYTNVGDGINMDTANEHLISTLQGFQLEAEDAMGIIDKFNEVANNFPIDTAGIGEALQRSAASFYAANTDLSKSIALITGTNSVVQDPDSVGTMWKTVSMRLRGVTQELEEAGLETDGMVESTAQLRDLIQGLTGFDIMTDEAGTQFKDIYDIVVGIGHEWKNLTDIEQAGLLEALAGKRQGNALSAALNNISMIEEAYKTAENSAGSALEEQGKYEQGIEYSLKRLEASFQAFANHIVDSDFVKGIVDFGNGIVNVLDTVTSKFGSLGTIGLGAGLFAGVKNTGKCRMSVRIS